MKRFSWSHKIEGVAGTAAERGREGERPVDVFERDRNFKRDRAGVFGMEICKDVEQILQLMWHFYRVLGIRNVWLIIFLIDCQMSISIWAWSWEDFSLPKYHFGYILVIHWCRSKNFTLVIYIFLSDIFIIGKPFSPISKFLFKKISWRKHHITWTE